MEGIRLRDGTGGLTVTEEMQRLADYPGFLLAEHGGIRLRKLYSQCEPACLVSLETYWHKLTIS